MAFETSIDRPGEIACGRNALRPDCRIQIAAAPLPRVLSRQSFNSSCRMMPVVIATGT
jgi:hypothetical protein